MSEPLLKHSRLPRKYEQQPPAEKPKLAVSGSLSGVDPHVLLQRYLSDESTSQIAADYKVTRQALGQYLLRHAEEEWKEAQVMRALARKEAAEDAMEVAQDPLALAKARELLKAAQWDLERTCRRIYGEDVKVEGQITPILNITINGTEEQKQPRHIQVSLAPAQLEAPQQSTAAMSDNQAQAVVSHSTTPVDDADPSP